MTEPQLYTTMEVAALLGCSRMSVYRLIDSGALRSIDISPYPTGRPTLRVSREELDRFLAARAVSEEALP